MASKQIAMFGPSIREPWKIVNRDVPECDVKAYMAAGYKLGSIPEPEPQPEPAIEAAEPVQESAPVKPKRGKK